MATTLLGTELPTVPRDSLRVGPASPALRRPELRRAQELLVEGKAKLESLLRTLNRINSTQKSRVEQARQSGPTSDGATGAGAAHYQTAPLQNAAVSWLCAACDPLSAARARTPSPIAPSGGSVATNRRATMFFFSHTHPTA
jgi:hypothetical protein